MTNDPAHTFTEAHNTWTRWCPGDGSSYLTRIITINNGPDHADRILLLNIDRTTWAFQYPTADYRLRETGHWNLRRARKNNIPIWIWKAAHPLLVHAGVARDPHDTTRPVRTVSLPATDD